MGDRNLELAKVADVHRTVWTGFLVPPETGTYRVGLAGTGATLELDGTRISDRRKARWNDLPGMTTLKLIGGKRYPFRIEGKGVDLVWKRVSEAPAAELKRAAAAPTCWSPWSASPRTWRRRRPA